MLVFDRSLEQPVPGQHVDLVLLLACGHGPATTTSCISVGVWTWAVGRPMNVKIGMWHLPAEMLWPAWGLGLPKCYGSFKTGVCGSCTYLTREHVATAC